MRQDPKIQNIFGTITMSEKTDKNLPSIITRPVEPGDERSGATNTTVEGKGVFRTQVSIL